MSEFRPKFEAVLLLAEDKPLAKDLVEFGANLLASGSELASVARLASVTVDKATSWHDVWPLFEEVLAEHGIEPSEVEIGWAVIREKAMTIQTSSDHSEIGRAVRSLTFGYWHQEKLRSESLNALMGDLVQVEDMWENTARADRSVVVEDFRRIGGKLVVLADSALDS